eukprot:m.39150 g.39150  ORF g.39150 m.39150 type:complete len:69 (+) comp14697_c0_seq2:102-308(+)
MGSQWIMLVFSRVMLGCVRVGDGSQAFSAECCRGFDGCRPCSDAVPTKTTSICLRRNGAALQVAPTTT